MINRECCYIYWDTIPDVGGKVHIQCVDCHKKNGLGGLWLWGYGNWDIICDCGKVINRKKTNEPTESIV